MTQKLRISKVYTTSSLKIKYKSRNSSELNLKSAPTEDKGHFFKLVASDGLYFTIHFYKIILSNALQHTACRLDSDH